MPEQCFSLTKEQHDYLVGLLYLRKDQCQQRGSEHDREEVAKIDDAWNSLVDQCEFPLSFEKAV